MSVELPFYRYGRLEGSTLVDDDTAARVNGKRLVICGGYVFAGSVQLHRLVMGCTRGDGNVVHHRNEDPTDNRRENLQVVVGMFEHGGLPHPWRSRACSLSQRVGWVRASELLAAERAAAGLRPIGGFREGAA